MSAETVTGGLDAAITGPAAIDLLTIGLGVFAIYLVAREGLKRIGVVEK